MMQIELNKIDQIDHLIQGEYTFFPTRTTGLELDGRPPRFGVSCPCHAGPTACADDPRFLGRVSEFG